MLGSGNGVFAGKEVQCAVVRFNTKRAIWVAAEKWHPEQVSKYCENGEYELKNPFSDTRGLYIDILKYVADATVVAPQTLIDQFLLQAYKIIKNY